jgi:hypothetical protein
MGVYWAGAIRILSPREWIDSPDLEEVASLFAANGPMAHEYSHLVLDYYTRGNYPRWFTEGMAQYIEWQITGFKFTAEPSKFGGHWYPLASMDKNFDDLPDQSLAYAQSLAAIQYLATQSGPETLPALIEQLKAGFSLEQSMEKVLGKDFKAFETEVKNWWQD